MAGVPVAGYDRAKEVKEFDDSKVGVKGLVDAGVTAIPRFFQHPPFSHSLHGTIAPGIAPSLPTVDLSLPRCRAVELASAAAREWGFFQVTNHGISLDLISAALSALQAFNELPTEVKAAHYTREKAGGVNFNTNFDLYLSDAASWGDTLQVFIGPTPPDFARMPEVCRQELLAWEDHALGLARRLMGLLSEGLGVEAGRLQEGLSCLDRRIIACHYYPYCPQPELTLGLREHTDASVLTVLVQNEVEGLMVRKGGAAGSGSGEWVKVETVPGAIVVNVGDTLQMISNDVYKSVEHKVMANPSRKPRVSIAIFYSPGQWDESTIIGPLQELVSQENPARYRQFTMCEALKVFFCKKLGSGTVLNHFKL